MSDVPTCPNCGGANLFETDGVPAVGAYSPNLLPGLGNAIHRATLRIVVCERCGLTRLFAGEKARRNLTTSSKWRPLEAEG